MFKPSAIISLLIMSTNVTAALTIPGVKANTFNSASMVDKTLAQTGLSQFEDDITDDQDADKLKLTQNQLHEAQVWGLTEDEEKRYVQLMQNRSHIYYEGLRQTPIDILGINARSEEERNHFAALSAAQEAQKVSKNIAWNNAFYKAYNKLFKGIPVVGEFDKSPYAPTNYKPITLKPGDKLYLFISPELAVKTVLMMLVEAVETTFSTELHIMLLDTDDLGIQAWANLHQIPLKLVKENRITLNHGELNFNALRMDKKTTPLLLLAREGSSSIVDLGRF